METTTYRVLGTTDTITACGMCGREELKGTVVLDTGDGTIHAGTGCAAKLAGRPATAITRAARAADKTARDATDAVRRAEAEQAAAAEYAALRAWVLATYGVDCATPVAMANARPGGLSPVALRAARRAATAPQKD